MSENEEAPLVVDGQQSAGPDELFARLEELGIEVETRTHPPVFTVDEARALRGEIPGCHSKNLFVRDHKKNMWLVVCREDRKLDMKALAGVLGSGRLSFGSPRRLLQHLGVIPGAVSPFAVLNDHEGAVQVAIDRQMLEERPWNFHPLDNGRTTSIDPDDLIRFLEAEDHSPRLVDLPG